MMSPEQAVFDAILLCVAGSLLTLLVSRSKTLAGSLAFGITVPRPAKPQALLSTSLRR